MRLLQYECDIGRPSRTCHHPVSLTFRPGLSWVVPAGLRNLEMNHDKRIPGAPVPDVLFAFSECTFLIWDGCPPRSVSSARSSGGATELSPARKRWEHDLRTTKVPEGRPIHA